MPKDPANTIGAMRLYSGRQADLLRTSEGRTAEAVTALDTCNTVNEMVQDRVAPVKKSVWSRLQFWKH